MMKLSIDTSLSSALYRANLLLRNTTQQELSSFEITIEQWSILRKLSARGDCNLQEAYNQKELSIECCKDQASLTRIVDILEKKGLAKRENSPNDRREFLILITAEGKRLEKEIAPFAQESVERINSYFTEDEMFQLCNLLNKLIDNLEK